MRPKDRALAERLDVGLRAYCREVRSLPGIQDDRRRAVLIVQLVDSVRRVKFVRAILGRDISPHRADPESDLFDPLRAAVVHKHGGHFDEACWCVFLFIQFGKHNRSGYCYAREVYRRAGEPGCWDWQSTSRNPRRFREWLSRNEDRIRRGPGGFGNHRKYESLSGLSEEGTGAAVESYVDWVHPPRTHKALIDEAVAQAGSDPRRAFQILYDSMNCVKRFGRTARFDYLTTLGKLELAPIEPGSPYLKGSSGPYRGAQLLFASAARGKSRSTLEDWLVELGDYLRVGMQVIEDALCNWQKSPANYRAFRG